MGQSTPFSPVEPTPATSTGPTDFVFLLERGFTMQALSSAIEVLRLARKIRGPDYCRYQVTAMAAGPIAASNGVEVVATGTPADAPPRSVILVIAGADASKRRNPALTSEIRRLRRRAHPVWGLSSGVVRLVEAGLYAPDAGSPAMRPPKVAAHWEDAPYLRGAFLELRLAASLFEWGDGIASCAGGGASADLMLDHLRRSGDGALVEEIVSRLILDGARDGRMAQLQSIDLQLSTTDSTVFAALRLMRGHIHEPLPIGEIAARCHTPLRRLERLFNRELGASPLRVYREIRLFFARQEVLAGRRAIGEIALDYGFSGDRFTRAYRDRFGASPRSERARRPDA